MEVIEFKVIMVGDTSVGKTALVYNYMKYDNNHPPSTTGASYYQGREISDDQRRQYNLNIWDTAGQEKFRSIVSCYFRKTTVAICVFDITRRSSFENLSGWIASIKEQSPGAKIVIVGNKVDLHHLRKVETDEAVAFARSVDAKIGYYETSAIDGTNVKDLFHHIAESGTGEGPNPRYEARGERRKCC